MVQYLLYVFTSNSIYLHPTQYILLIEVSYFILYAYINSITYVASLCFNVIELQDDRFELSVVNFC